MAKSDSSLLGDVLQLAPADLEQANRYAVRRILGEGGMGKVLLGFDERLQRDVAIKVLTSLDDQNRFYREARLLATFSHPGIVKVIDYSGPSCAQPYLVMELLNGKTLAEAPGTKPLGEHAVIALAYQLAQALEHAHAGGVIHRDIKPENVMLQRDGRVVLIDFGLAKGTLRTADRQTLIASVTKMLGTPAYASPEQLSGEGVLAPRSDLFSLGSTLYFAACGHAPWASDNILELVELVMRSPHPPLKRSSRELNAIIDRLLAKRPADRPADAAELVRLLAPLLNRSGDVSPHVTLAKYLGTATASGSLGFGEMRVGNDATAVTTLPTETQVTAAPEDATTIATVSATRVSTAPSVRPARPRRSLWPVALALPLIAAIAVVAVLFARPAPPPPVLPIAPLPVPAPNTATPPAPEKGLLRVIVKPWGEVSIDGQVVGNTPAFSEVRLSVGDHEVKVTHPKLGSHILPVHISSAATERDVLIDLTHK